MKKNRMRVAAALMMAAMTTSMVKMTAVAMVGAAGVVLTSCSSDKDNADDPTDVGNDELKYISLTRAQAELVEHSNDFAFNLFRQITLGGPAGPCDPIPQSIILSPISVTYALGMLNNGATGETQQQINEVLGFGQTGAEGINDFCRKMLTEAPALDKQTKVMIANTIYMNKGYELKPMFVQLAKEYYDAEPETRDFHDGKTRNVINKWGSDHTEGMIEEVLKEGEFNADAVSYLLNAIYFKGTWTEKFNKNETADQTFRGEDDTELKLPMMHMEHKFDYAENDLYQSVRLPYGNGAYAMTVLLPREGKTVDEVLATLTAESWRRMPNGSAIVDLKLPRFESNTDVNLSWIMSLLGMKKAFTEEAEFGNFCLEPTYIGLMKQVARIKLDEAGTEAAAVTVIGMETAAAPDPEEPQRVEFHATRPFLYVISEQSTNAIFFIGKYVGK